jgi:hypothetical protein
MNNEQWKDEILNSMHGAKRAEPHPFLFTRILAKIETSEQSVRHSYFKVRLAVSLCALILILNVTLIVRHVRNSAENGESATYSLNDNQYQLY